MPPLIEVVHANYVAGGTPILTDASWTIQAGQRWAVLGPNGAGKTTLLRIAGGYLWPNAGGTVKRLGEELVDLRVLRKSIGWVANTMTIKVPPREPALDTVVSGAIAQLGLTMHQGCEPTPEQYQRAEAILDRLKLTELQNRPFGVLSQGEQQAVLVARASMAEPMLIVLDEPCVGMDPGTREKFLTLLSNILDEDSDTSIVMVTHHVEEILPQIDNILTVQDGRVAAVGTRKKLLTQDSISQLYSAPVRKLEIANGRVWPIW